MIGKIAEIVNFFTANPGYLKWGKQKLASKLKVDMNDIIEAKKIILKPEIEETMEVSEKEYAEFCKYLESKEMGGSVEEPKSKLPKPFKGGDPGNVLVIGDLHEPFSLEGYLEFCREQQEKFNCGTVIVIGDIVDGASWNFHEKNPDSDGQADEINKAIVGLADWYKVFPEARVTMGNHDLLIARKVKAIGLSERFMKPFNEIWNAPKEWEFGYEFIINNVRYIHGTRGNAFTIAKESRMSTVQGHLHSQSFVQWSVSEKDRIFGVQTGCGIDYKNKAFEYSKPFPKKPVIGCAVILDKGTTPISLTMEL